MPANRRQSRSRLRTQPRTHPDAKLLSTLRDLVVHVNFNKLRKAARDLLECKGLRGEDQRERKARLCQIRLSQGDIVKAAAALRPHVKRRGTAYEISCRSLIGTGHEARGTGLLLSQLSAFIYQWKAIGGEITRAEPTPLEIVEEADRLFRFAATGLPKNYATAEQLMIELYKSRLMRQEGPDRLSESARTLDGLLDRVLSELAGSNAAPWIAWVAAQVLEEAAMVSWREGDGRDAQLKILRAAALVSCSDIVDDLSRAGIHYVLGRIESVFSKSRFRIALAALSAAERIYRKHRFRHRTRVQITQTLIKAGQLDRAQGLIGTLTEDVRRDGELSPIEKSYLLADLELAGIWMIQRKVTEASAAKDWRDVAEKAGHMVKTVGRGTRLAIEGQLHLGLAKLELWRADGEGGVTFDEAVAQLDTARKAAETAGRMKIVILAHLGLSRAYVEKANRPVVQGGHPLEKGRMRLVIRDHPRLRKRAIRELNSAESLLARRKSSYLEAVHNDVQRQVRSSVSLSFPIGKMSFKDMEALFKTEVLSWALYQNGNSQAKAARVLKVPRATLSEWLVEVGLRERRPRVDLPEDRAISSLAAGTAPVQMKPDTSRLHTI